MKNMPFKKNALIFIILLSFFFCNNCFCPPWNSNTREHLFGNPANASIEDEGFRWKDSFNFDINGTPFPANVADWKFKKVIRWDAGTFKRIDAANDWQNSNPNEIHQHLSQLVSRINQLFPQNTSVTVAALTIVVDARLDGSPNPVYRAYSKVIESANRVLVAINNANLNNHMFVLVGDGGMDIFNNLNYIDSNIPSRPRYHGGFSYPYICTEGKILSRLIESPLLQAEIELLRVSAINEEHKKERPEWLRRHASLSGHCLPPLPIISADKIKLVILHIGTKMDPCAICTRNLVALSRDMNYHPPLLPGRNRYNLGANINAKFLVEVSSNGHYGSNAQQEDCYACPYIPAGRHYEERIVHGNCSHTECAGHDNRHGTLADIALNGVFPMNISAADQRLVIPSGAVDDVSNWRFHASFPPHVVFGRTGANGNVISAPIYNQQHNPPVDRNNVCNAIVIGPPQRHNANGSNAAGRHLLRNNLRAVN
ncbi:MAG: hypothetical protein LBG04_03120 [Holosporaceae bacterium]|jgi:hypothetical protein|nr:hypothetical protein [Holosporaceae bacterium]